MVQLFKVYVLCRVGDIGQRMSCFCTHCDASDLQWTVITYGRIQHHSNLNKISSDKGNTVLIQLFITFKMKVNKWEKDKLFDL